LGLFFKTCVLLSQKVLAKPFLYPDPYLLPNRKEKGSGSMSSGSPRFWVIPVIQNAHPVIKMADF